MHNLIVTRIRQLWMAGSGLEGISRAAGVSIAVTAEQVAKLSDEDLLAGLKAHLQLIVAVRARPAAPPASGRGK